MQTLGVGDGMSEDIFVVNVNDDEYESVDILDLESDIDLDERVHVIEVEDSESMTVETFDAFNALGEPNEQLKHQLLNGRDVADQHPITAITGLKDKLDDIEALKTVYSNEKQSADYYQWEDDNVIQENRIGLFVTLCEDINKIRVCTEDDDIFGVVVDAAGFIGGQSDIARDYKYGLVAINGVVHVRCEESINIGDYIFSNNYGYAQKNKSGYKVVGRHQIDGMEYVEIPLVTPIGKICELTDDVEKLGDRMDDAEINITAAINVANAAYNKAGEVGEVSEEAIKNALNALNKVTDISNKTDSFESRLTSANEVAVQAQAISQSAELAAERIRKEAVATANNALTEVNNTQDELDGLINNINPLITWEGENGSGISGFINQVEADRITLGNLSKWDDGENGTQSLSGIISTVGKHEAILTGFTGYDGEVKEIIAQVEQKADNNGASITSLVTSVDKYSVGEFSQAYGLTREQAKNILKPGYIYIPTKHKDKQSHSEIMWENSEEKEKGEEGQKETNEFTPGDYYVWGINDQDNADWVEHSVGTVWISEAIPANSNGNLKYWYIDSNESPQGYEAYALYIWEDSKWEKVNTLAGNASNRAVSMIRQATDEIAAEVTNARGSYAGLSARLEADKKAQVEMVASVVNEDGTINTASIINSVNGSDSSVAINADHIVLNGYTSNANGSFQIDEDGYMIAKGGNIGGWIVEGSKPEEFGNVVFIGDSYTKNKEINPDVNATEYKKGWPYYCAHSLGISSDNYFDAGLSGAGFYPYDIEKGRDTFQDCLENMFTKHKTDDWRKGITHIIIGGGYNDAYYKNNKNYEYKSELPDKIDYFVTKLKELCNSYNINPKIYLFALGKSCVMEDDSTERKKELKETQEQKNKNLIKVYDLYETKAKEYGWTFYDIHNTWQGKNGGLANYVGLNTFDGSSYSNFGNYPFGDTTHPNTTGLMSIGSTVASYLKYEKGRLYNPPAGYEFKDKYNTNVSSTVAHGNSGFYLSNRPGDWAIEIGPKAYSYENVGGSSNPHRPFLVGQNGNLWAQNARISGTINATSGSIAGFNIGKSNVYPNALYKTTQSSDGKTKYEIGMKATNGDTDAAFYIRSSTDNWKNSKLVFYIRNNGELFATAGSIAGWNITTDHIDSTVSGTKQRIYLASASDMATNWIRADDADGTRTFSVTKDGHLYARNADISGTINATSGTIGGCTISGGTLTISNANITSLNVSKLSGGTNTNNVVFTNITGTMQQGSTLCDGVKFGTSGFTKILDYSYGQGHGGTRWQFGNNEDHGITLTTTTGGNTIYLKAVYGYLQGTWKLNSSAISTSDQNAKNSIEIISDTYETIFDNLQPVTYKYNDGTSSRIHTGFIAQNVADAVEKAGLTTTDFAAVCYNVDENGDKVDWGIRYGELVSLNTWQIQKTKTRITELEERVTQLEKLIKEK